MNAPLVEAVRGRLFTGRWSGAPDHRPTRARLRERSAAAAPDAGRPSLRVRAGGHVGPARLLHPRAAHPGPGTFPPFAYYPVGGGARQCIGSVFALVESQIVLATLAQRFEPELLPGQEVVPDATFILRPRHDIRTRLRRRAPA
jgi:hypothetical protein